MKEVQDWSAAQSVNRELLIYLQKRKAQLTEPLKQSDIDGQWLLLLDRMFQTTENPRRAGFPRLYWLTGMAAAFLLLSTLGWYYFKVPVAAPQLQVIQTTANMRRNIVLSDGTHIYMAPGSKLTFDALAFGVKKREMHLTGEAFFNVKHRPDKPFIITTDNGLTVSVLGTSFNVYSRPHAVTDVKVASGLVGISTYHHITYLKAGQQLAYQTGSHQLKVSKVKLRQAAALQNQALVFDDDNAAAIAQKLQRWYNIKVIALPAAKKHARFSGELKDTGLANVLQALKYATGLHYRFENSNTLLLF